MTTTRTSTRLIAFCVCTALILCALPVAAKAAPDTSWYGDGSADSFTISTADELAGLAEIVNNITANFYGKTITLGADIDLSSYDNWVPIGFYDGGYNGAFRGSFNGNGHVISNLRIRWPNQVGFASSGAALFGCIGAGSVSNLGMENVDIESMEGNSAGIVGYCVQGSIENCYVTGRILGNTGTGGIAGTLDEVSIENCYSTALVGAYPGAAQVYNVGGIVGFIWPGTVKNCAALGSSVSGYENVDRIVGRVDPNYSSTVDNNVAWDEMSVTADVVSGKEVAGDDISTAAILADGTIGGRFAQLPWATQNGKLPGFGLAEDLPPHFPARPSASDDPNPATPPENASSKPKRSKDVPPPIVAILTDIQKSGETFTFTTYIANGKGNMAGASVTVRLNEKYSTTVTIGEDGYGQGTLEAPGFTGDTAHFSTRPNVPGGSSVGTAYLIYSSGEVVRR